MIGALAGVVAGLSVFLLPAQAGQPGSCDELQQLTPDQLVACLQVGPVDLAGATITGGLDLTAVDVVPYPFRCVDCTFTGDVNVSDVTFDRLVAFERVVIEGDLDARGARFAGAVLARGQRGGESRPASEVTPTSRWPGSTRRCSSTRRPSGARSRSRALASPGR